MHTQKRTWRVLLALWLVMMGAGGGGVWLFAAQAGVHPFSDSRMLWVFIVYTVLVQCAVAATWLAGRRAARIIAKQTEEVASLFSVFSPTSLRFYNRPYLVMNVQGATVIVTWFYQPKRVVGTEAAGLLYVKIPGTNGIRLHATTRLQAPQGVATMAGWRCLDSGICLGPVRTTSTSEAETYAQRLTPGTIAMMSDVAIFPYGVSILSNWHERMVGKAAALAMVDGDKEKANDLDVQVRFSLDIGAQGVEQLVQDAVAVAGMIAKDFHRNH